MLPESAFSLCFAGMPTKAFSMLIKPRNLRVIVLTLIAGTLLVAIYHLYYNDDLPASIPPTHSAPADNMIDEQGGYHHHQHHHHSAALPEIKNPGGRSDVLARRDNPRINVDGRQSNHEHQQTVSRHLHAALNRVFNASSVSAAGRQARVQNTGAFKCPKLDPFTPDIDVQLTYPNLEFDADWIRTREYWNPVYEKRYQSIKNKDNKKERARPTHNLPQQPSLKVFVIPHSHNDPGWLKTFEGYYFSQTKEIIDNIVDKLTEFKHMKFLWSEISFLSKWWEHAHPTKRHLFKQLVAEGRLEIVTGGWVNHSYLLFSNSFCCTYQSLNEYQSYQVDIKNFAIIFQVMTDEATVNLYSMIDQLVEGHQWVKAHLGVVPKSSWSIDPFGHGSVWPYILQASSISGMVVQRIHFGWKKWFADQQKGDFLWVQRWDNLKKHSIRCHNAPWDIYSIKHSCGPFPQVCLNFDFRNISGDYSENYMISTPITAKNVMQKAELMLEQYGRTASLFTHNVAMISMGDDFRFQKPIEWDQQYENYMKLFEYINANKHVYNAEVQFGTVNDYFKALEERHYQWPTLSGDFFVYSDIFSEGRPAYWSGYYSTRPYWKKFYRETESILRGAEILFTFSSSLVSQNQQVGDLESQKILNHQYEQLTVARRWLALFAHHDATTGTSKQDTMNDYGLKLLEAWQYGVATQIASLGVLLFGSANNSLGLRQDFELDKFGELPRQLPLQFPNPQSSFKRLVFYNSLARKRVHLAKMVVTSPNVEVLGPDGQAVVAQLNPVLEITENSMVISGSVFEVSFLTYLPPLSVAVYQIRMTKSPVASTVKSVVYCKACTSPVQTFEVNAIQTGDIQLNNERLQLLFDRDSGFLMKVTKVGKGSVNCQMSFGGYASIDFRSGAYLLMPDTNTEQEIPFKYANGKTFIVSGPLYSELSVSHAPILLSTRLMHTGGEQMESAIWMTNQVDLGRHNGEIFLRFETNVQSEAKLTHPDYEGSMQPAWWSDQSGWTFEKRVKIPKIRYEGNTYPVNNMAYLQDNQWRISLLVDRSHGCTSMELGRLECMIERRTIFDDSRGMGEGVTDNRPTISNYVLHIENLDGVKGESEFQKGLPTLQAHHISLDLSYPATMYLYDDDKFAPVMESSGGEPEVIPLLNQELPCDVHLLNLRTLTDSSLDYDLNLPSAKALMILQRFGYSCAGMGNSSSGSGSSGSEGEGRVLGCGGDGAGGMSLFWPNTQFNGLKVAKITQTDLTGVSSQRQQASNYRGERNLSALHQVMGEPFEITSVVLDFSG